MKNKILINQYQGLGDILFCEPVARHYYNLGQQIIWPILDTYLWIKEYINYINFIPKSQFPFNYELAVYPSDEFDYLPLRFANPLFRNIELHDYSDQLHCMLDKYRFLNLSEELWRTLKWTRNLSKEQELYDLVIGDKQQYTLINNMWGNNYERVHIEETMDSVYTSIVPGFTMLDWSLIYEKANMIKTVSTSNLYMIEALGIKCPVYIFPRRSCENLDGIREFVNKSYILVE